MSDQNLNKNYFPNLDGLRFIAAALVIVHHIELYKAVFKMPNYYESIGFVKVAGKLGVVLFFVLSGFLIFSLLIKEKSKNESVNIKLFYYRRLLRIWPLYFLILSLGLFVLPNIDFFKLDMNFAQSKTLGPLLYTFMLPNVAVVMYILIPYVAQVWSLGIEEQFYIAAPIFVNYFQRLKWVLFGVIILTILLKFFFWFTSENLEVWNGKLYFFNNFSYSCIAIGGLASYLVFVQKTRFIGLMFNKWIQGAVWALTVFLLLGGFFFPVFQFEIFAFLFAIIILNLACNPNTLVKLDYPVMNYLGKISYGLYMYHAIVVVVVLKTLSGLNIQNMALVYAAVFSVSIALAALSYRFFESPFLKIKSRLQVYK